MVIEFGTLDKGSGMIIDRDLYGLKSSGEFWHAKLLDTLNPLRYHSTESHPCVR